jgi:hypothetical protein
MGHGMQDEFVLWCGSKGLDVGLINAALLNLGGVEIVFAMSPDPPKGAIYFVSGGYH